MSSSCQELMHLLKDCLMNSDCVQKRGNLPSKCLRDEEIPECQSLRLAMFDCKRGMLDMRRRFRGNVGYMPPPSTTPSSASSSSI